MPRIGAMFAGAVLAMVVPLKVTRTPLHHLESTRKRDVSCGYAVTSMTIRPRT